MWSYYGSKNRISWVYPKPIFNKIKEPFAGAGYYSLRYFENDITLIDKSQMVIDVWIYLQSCSLKDLQSLPLLAKGHLLDRSAFDCEGQYQLMRFLIAQASYGGNNIVSKWGALRLHTNYKRLRDNHFKIKHWNFICEDYVNIPNEECTWFIDAPYFVGGHKYPHGNKKIDFNHLANWCESRTGQVIVCENTKASWLPFKPVIEINGVQHKTTEAIWTNYKTHFDNV